MKKTKQIATITLIILLAVIAYGLFRTGISTTETHIISAGEPSGRRMGPRSIKLLCLPRSYWPKCPPVPAEVALAEEAVRLGDREMDWPLRQGCGKPKCIRRR